MGTLLITLAPNPPFSRSQSPNIKGSLPKLITNQWQVIHKRSNDVRFISNSYKSHFNHISALCKDGNVRDAVDLISEMCHRNFQIGPDIYGELLQGCVYVRAFFLGQQIHAQIIKMGERFEKNEFVETKLVVFYAKCEALEVANSLFRSLKSQNVFSWAAIIGVQCRMGFYQEALLGHCEMQESGFSPDNFVVPNVLKACAALGWDGFGKGIHGYIIKMMGFGKCVFVASSLVDMYGKCGLLEDAKMVFDSMPDKNAVTWNSLIVSYVQNGRSEEAVKVFYDMRVDDVEPTEVTLSGLLSASANLDAHYEGRQVHALAVISGLNINGFLGSSLLNFYSKVGMLEDAELVFSRISEKDIVTWNLLISSYVKFGLLGKALKMCLLMRQKNLRLDSVTLTSLMIAAANTRDVELGREGHCYCIRNNLETDLAVSGSIIGMYAKCARIHCAEKVFAYATRRDLGLYNALLAAYAELGLSGEALKLFYQMQLDSIPTNVASWNSIILAFLRNGQAIEAQDMFFQMIFQGVEPNHITWTTLISGLVQIGFPYKAIIIFQQMQDAGIRPCTVSIVGALSACTKLALFRFGKAIHGYVTRHETYNSDYIATPLLDMYAKCGSIDSAKRVFSISSRKQLPLYNAMISAYACHGEAMEAIVLFRHLQKEGLEPDDITFTSVLSACGHGGLVEEGLEIFNYLVSHVQLKPNAEHCGCIINLLCRYGRLDEAVRIFLTMSSDPDPYILGSLFAACQQNHRPQLGEYILQYLLQLDPDNSGNFIALSNAYARVGRWDKVSQLRSTMKEMGIRKSPGCSWIEVGQEYNVFVSSDRLHPKTEEIYMILDLIYMQMHNNKEAEFLCYIHVF